MVNRFRSRRPFYPDDSDYNTNAPSYYDDLARKTKLIKLLSKRIWEYDEELGKRFDAWDKNLEEFPENVEKLLRDWMDDDTFAHIINEEIFSWKADKVDLDYTNDNLNSRNINVKYPPIPLVALNGDGLTDDTENLKALGAYAFQNQIELFIPNGHYIIDEKIDVNWSMRGETTRGVLFDFSSNVDGYCFKAQAFRLFIQKFSIKLNKNIPNQLAMDLYYSTDSSKFQDIVIEDDAPNGIRLSRLWYANLNNIRMRRILSSGYGLIFESDSSGGINAVDFNNIYIQGGKHSVLFKGNSYISEVLNFNSCTFENVHKTAIKIESDQFRNIKFNSCYFENIYLDTDSNVPVLLDSVVPRAIVDFDNCMVRAGNTNGKHLLKGGATLSNFTNANGMPLNAQDDTSEIFTHNVRNVRGIPSSYLGTTTHLKMMETIRKEDALKLYKKQTGVVTVPINKKTRLFRVQTSTSNTVTFLKMRLIIESIPNQYVSSSAEFIIQGNAKGTSPSTVVKEIAHLTPNSTLFSERVLITGTTSKYNPSTDRHEIDIEVVANHDDFAGRYYIEVEGMNTTRMDDTSKAILFNE